MTIPFRTRLTAVAAVTVVAVSLLTAGSADASSNTLRSVQKLMRAATHQTTSHAGHRAAVRAHRRLGPAARRNSHVSHVLHSSITVSAGNRYRCITWNRHSARAVVPLSCARTWTAFGRLTTAATAQPDAVSGHNAASALRTSFIPALRSATHLSTVGNKQFSLVVNGFRRCLDWTSGQVQVSNGRCTDTSGTRVGVYNGGPSGDDAARSLFGRYAQISSSYYQVNQQALNVPAEEARMNKGIATLITITSKGTQYLADIAAKSGPGWTWVQSYVGSLSTLSAYAQSKNLPIYATLDHEWEVKVNQGKMTGASATPAVYARALSNFYALCASQAPHLKTVYWFGGFDKTAIQAVGADLSVKPDQFSFDPYSSNSHPANETLTQLAGPTTSWLRGRSWYAQQPIGLSELGANHTDSSMAEFYSGLRTHLSQLHLSFGVVFNRTDQPFVVTLTPASYPESVRAVASSFSTS